MTEGIPTKLAWGKKASDYEEQPQQESPIVSFVEIMEEQEHEEELENIRIHDSIEFSTIDQSMVSNENPDCSQDYLIALELSRDPDCSADELLAMKMQREFDREHELSQKFEESRTLSGKVTAVLESEPYSSRAMREDEASSDEEDDKDDDEMRQFATSLLYEKREQDYEFPSCGFLQKDDGTILTKHDRELDERKNNDRVMQLPLALHTGNIIGGKGEEHRISRRVYNELRTFGKSENKRQMRVKDKEEKATSELSVDVQTRLTLLKWINSGEIDRVEGIIATGKESVVLHAVYDGATTSSTMDSQKSAELADKNEEMISSSDESQEEDKQTAMEETQPEGMLSNKMPAHPTGEAHHYAIKVYKTTLAGFKNRAEYVKNDFRFKNPRRVMKIWAEKEFLNLNRLRRANIRCPTPIKLKKHILLMSMIGESVPAPKLREILWSSESDTLKSEVFGQVRQILNSMYKQCHLVHGDLSEFNLLFHAGQVYVIDMAQAMDLSHPSSLRFLYRDVTNVLNFFGYIGCDQLPSAHEIFNEITGIEFDTSQDLYVQVETFERENRNMDIRDGKKHSANYELRRYESTGREDSPSRPYN